MAEFTNRGTGGTVPLNKYGTPGTFTLAVAEKLAATGLTEAEYVLIAQKYKTSEKRLEAYINFFRKEGFNIVLENGRYVEKKELSNLSGSTSHTQVTSNGDVPTKTEVEKNLRGIAPKGNEVDEEALKRTIEFSFALEKRKLKPDWWEITKRNLDFSSTAQADWLGITC